MVSLLSDPVARINLFWPIRLVGPVANGSIQRVTRPTAEWANPFASESEWAGPFAPRGE